MDFKFSRKLIDSLSYEEEKRLSAMSQTLESLSRAPLILKGGSAIMFFYEGDRFSEDLDFDAYTSPEQFLLPDYVRQLKKTLKFEVRIAKDTSTTKRLKIFVDDIPKAIKVEISFRKYHVGNDMGGAGIEFSGLQVYSIDAIMNMKVDAFQSRTAGRDLYDIAFILTHWSKHLKPETLERIAAVFGGKTVEDWLLEYEDSFQEDPKLGEDAFYLTYSRLSEGLKKVRFLLSLGDSLTDSEGTISSGPRL